MSRAFLISALPIWTPPNGSGRTRPHGALPLVSAIVVAYFYPLTRQRHERIVRLLEKRRARAEA